MDELTTLREAWEPVPAPSPAARAAARAALQQRIMAARQAGGPPRRPLTTQGRGSRRFVAAGAIAVTAAAAAAAALLVTGAPASHPRSAPSSTAVPGAVPSARAFLLASAVTVASTPAATGAYWYSQTRSVEPTMPVGGGTVPKAGKRPKKVLLPGMTFTSTEESWNGQARSRTIVDEDVTFSFASPQVKAEWVALGRPPLATAQGTSTRPFTSDYAMSFHYGPGAGLDFDAVKRLPATASGLGAVLRQLWTAIPDDTRAAVVGEPHPTFGQYLGLWISALIEGPATPGTKAAAYRLLAGQPGVTVLPSVTDPLGRMGVAIAVAGDYLIIDPRTAQVLAFTSGPVHPHSQVGWSSGVSVVLSAGWTSQVGIRPGS